MRRWRRRDDHQRAAGQPGPDEDRADGVARPPGRARPERQPVRLPPHGWGGGVDEALYIRPDGAARVELNGKATRFQLSRDELDRFRSLIAAARFESLKPRYSSGGVVADGFVIDVTADGRTVTVEQPAEAPPALGNLMGMANELIERHR